MPEPKPNQTPAQSSNQPSAQEKAYMDAKRFPLTTQPGLTFSGQKMIDAVNKDDCLRMREHGQELNAKQEAAWLEFEAKASILKSDPNTPSSVA